MKKIACFFLFLLLIFGAKSQIITTVVGNGTGGYSGDGGQATAAELNTPEGIIFDASGNMYIADAGNSRVRIVNTSGIISTFAGNGHGGFSGDGGQATAAELEDPQGATFDASGNFYITDNNRVRKVSTSGIISTIAGIGVSGYSGDGGQATAAEVAMPRGIALDASGNIYLGDWGNNRVRIINTSGVISTYAGNGVAGFSGNGGQATAAEFSGPSYISLDASGNLYIGDLDNMRIRKVNTSGVISTFAGGGGGGDGSLATAASLMQAMAPTLDASGNMYIACYNGEKIRVVYQSTGKVYTFAGDATAGYSGDGGQATVAEIKNPYDVALDPIGNVYIADHSNNRIREVYLNLEVTTSVTANVSCNGGSNGSASATPTRGTTPYTYSWSPGGGTSSTYTGLSAGTYTVTVSNPYPNFTVTGTASVTITQPASALSVSANTTANVSCNGASNGSVSSSVSGGTSPYTYSWSPGGGTNSTYTGLSAGTYTITVTDNNGCTATASTTVTQPATGLSVSASVTANVICNGASTGSMSSSASGGTSPYTYLWSPGGGTNSTYTALAAGTYTITVTDNNGCTGSASATVTQPPALSVSASVSANVICNGASTGSVSASASGGTTPYTYLWTIGGGTNAAFTGLSAATYTITVTDNCGATVTAATTVTQPATLSASASVISEVTCNGGSNGSASATASNGTSPYTYSWTPGGATTASITGLGAGTYGVTITDNCGASATASVTITQPIPLGVLANGTNINCYGASTGSVMVSPLGGTSPYTYSWSPGGATTASVTGLSAGTYIVSLTDNCGANVSATVTLTQPAAALSVTAQPLDNVSCYGGSNGTAIAGVSGGTTPYTYLWSPGGGTNYNYTGLTAGTYTVTVTDANGCTASASATITQPALLTVTANIASEVTCGGGDNGSLQAIPSGGTMAYTYLWMPGSVTSPAYSGLTAGTYTITVTDNNGCTASASATITQPYAIRDSVVSSTCSGYNGATAVIGVKYGTTPYTYLWSACRRSTATVTGLTQNTYTVLVTDNNGCTGIVTVGIAGCRVSNYNYAIHYTYDVDGNVASIVTENNDVKDVKQRFKKTDYYYDLVSGKVNEVVYEHDSTDQYMQNYDYDADNRITDVQTSHDSVFWENDASYEYYSHGPLAREILGRRQVQGVDYAYTLNGWIKGVNSSVLNPSYDMGADGNVHGDNRSIARDAYGYTLNYFNGDYRAIGAANFQATGLPYTSLYNGNIASATYSIKPLLPKTIGYVYGYDQLNRITSEKAFAGIDTTTLQWVAGDSIPSFRERENYDENGNVLTYVRHGNTTIGPEAMDSLNYYYNKGTNQLNWVHDTVSASNYPNDIDNEHKNNYKYNNIGELAKDDSGKIDTIIWNVYGKIKKIIKPSVLYAGLEDSIVFAYDPLGNRLEKRTYTAVYCHLCAAPPKADTILYQRDAQGDILAMYERRHDTVKLNEWDLYGSKRIGTLDTNLLIYPYAPKVPEAPLDSITISYLEGQKQYELTNHLGNVLVTISDRKWSVDTTITPNIANYYLPNIISAQDYYPFGIVEPGRKFKLLPDSCYKFGFNGKLKDNDIYGDDNSEDYGMREYLTWLIRTPSPDPLSKEYPMLSPYQFFSDSPIMNTDLDGQESNNATTPTPPVKTIPSATDTKEGVEAMNKALQQGSSGTGDAVPGLVEDVGGAVLRAASLTLGFVLQPTKMGSDDMGPMIRANLKNFPMKSNTSSPQPQPAAKAKQYSKSERENSKIFYVTYTKTKVNADGTTTTYSGRTSGLYSGEKPTVEDAQRAVSLRDITHIKLNSEGFLPAVVDRYKEESDDGYEAIRGREQQLIDYHGGAQSDGGKSRNRIRGVGKDNPEGTTYHEKSNEKFGELYKYTGNK